MLYSISRVLTFWLLFSLLPLSSGLAFEGVRQEEVKEPPKPKLTKPPKMLKFIEAVYPATALKDKTQASVEMLITLDNQGNVTDVKVTKPAGLGFDLAAMEAIKKFKFSPAEVDGKPSPIQIIYVYNFIIKEEVKKPDFSRPGLGTISVKGRVREAGTRLGIAGAAVSTGKTMVSVTADKRGFFQIRGLAPGKYRLLASSPEHQKLDTPIEVKEGMETQIDLYLQPLVENPYETVVRGERFKQVVTRYTVQQRQLVTVPGTFGDPIRVVQNLPGSSRAPGILGVMLIRGSSPQDSKTFIDGVEVPLLFHFLGGPSIINAQILDKIDYYPGNFSARYGNASAGIIDVKTKNTSPERWRGSTQIDFLHSGAYIEGPVTDKLSFALAGRRSYIDLLLPSVLEAAGQESLTVAPFYWDYQIKTDYSLPGDDRLSLFSFASHDSLTVVDTTGSDTEDSFSLKTRIGFYRTYVKWLHNVSDQFIFTLQPFYAYSLFRMELQDINIDNNLLEWGARSEVEWIPSKQFNLTLGMDARYSNPKIKMKVPAFTDTKWPGTWTDRGGSNFSDEMTTIVRTIDGYLLAPYLTATWKILGNLQLIPGLRANYNYYHSGGNRFCLDPRLVIRWILGPETVIKAGAGLYSQLPDFQYFDEQYGNPDIPFQRAEQYGLGIEQKLTSVIDLDLQAFYIYRYDIPWMSDQYRGEGENRRRERFAPTGQAFAFGMEAMLKHQVTRSFYGWVAYTLSQSKQKMRGDLPWRLTTFDQTHILTVVGSWKPVAGWEMGIRFRLVSGNPDTPVTSSTFDADTQNYKQLTGGISSIRNPLFNQLDFRIEKSWTFQYWVLSLYLDIQNVYNAENQEATRWDYRFKYSGAVPGLPILPTLGIKGSF